MKIPALFFTATLLLCAHDPLMAGPITGGEMTYRCLGNAKYEINMYMYGDCTMGTMTNPLVNIQPLACSGPGSTSITLQLVAVKDITPVCNTVQSNCSGGTFTPGIRYLHYRDTIDLSPSSYASCCKFNLSYTRTSGRINNLKCYSNTDFGLFATLNKCVVPCNSSPVPMNPPPMYACMGQDLCFNNGFRDTIDGDSISVSLVDPITNSTGWPSAINCVPGFLGSPNKNASLPAGFHVDAVTGDICFRPMKMETGTIAIEATEWRKINGTITNISQTRRDMNLYIINCPTNKTPNVPGPYAYDICANSTLCFSIQSTDADTGDTVRVSWNNSIKSAAFTSSFSSTITKKEKGTFCWTPSDSDVSNRPYYFTVTARDNACPTNNRVTKSYSVSVNAVPKATRLLKADGCGGAAFKIIPAASYGNLTYRWTVRKDSVTVASYTSSSDSMFYRFSGPGTYIIKSNLSTPKNCSADYFDTLVVDTFFTVKLPPDTVVCRGSSLNVVSATQSGTAPYRYQWSSGIADTLPDLNLTVDSNSSYAVIVTDSFGCTASDTIKVSFRQPSVSAGADLAACFVSGSLTLTGLPAGGTWRGSAVSANTFDPIAAGTGAHDLIYLFSDSTGCSAEDTMTVTIHSLPAVNAGSNVALCIDAGNLYLSGNPAGGSWSGSGVSAGYFNPSVAGVSIHTLIYAFTDNNGCMNTDSVQFTINPLPVVSAGNDILLCAGSGMIHFTGVPAGGFWSGTAISGNMFDPAISGRGIFEAVYELTDNNGCTGSDTAAITVTGPQADFNGTYLPTAFIPLSVLFVDNSTGTVNKWDWNFGDPASGMLNTSALQNPVHIYNKAGTYSVKLKVTDSLTGCSDEILKQNFITAINTGVSDFTVAEKFNIFPNPASKFFEIVVSGSVVSSFTMIMYDIHGKKVKEASGILPGLNTIRCEELPAGIYQIIIQTDNSDEVYKQKLLLE